LKRDLPTTKRRRRGAMWYHLVEEKKPMKMIGAGLDDH
jgi:heat shock protein HspQ